MTYSSYKQDEVLLDSRKVGKNNTAAGVKEFVKNHARE